MSKWRASCRKGGWGGLVAIGPLSGTLIHRTAPVAMPSQQHALCKQHSLQIHPCCQCGQRPQVLQDARPPAAPLLTKGRDMCSLLVLCAGGGLPRPVSPAGGAESIPHVARVPEPRKYGHCRRHGGVANGAHGCRWVYGGTTRADLQSF